MSQNPYQQTIGMCNSRLRTSILISIQFPTTGMSACGLAKGVLPLFTNSPSRYFQPLSRPPTVSTDYALPPNFGKGQDVGRSIERAISVSRRRIPRSISIDDNLWEQVKAEANTYGMSASQVVISALAQYFQSQLVRSSSWDTDDSDAWYDESKIYTFSQDKHGHSAKVELYIPKMVAGEVTGLVESTRIPELRTPQDFYRNAIRHQVYRYGKILRDDRLIESAHIMTLRDQIASDQAETTEVSQIIESMGNMLDQAIQLGHYDFVEQRLKYLWDSSNSVSERFRDEYLNTLIRAREKLDRVRDRGSSQGTVTYPDGTREKNGIELAPRQRRRSGPH